MNRFTFFSIRFCLLGLLLLTASCDQKTSTPVLAVDTPAFVGTRWQMTSFYLNPSIDFDGDGTLDTNLLSFMAPCDRDNSLMFNADGTLSLLEGPTSCRAFFDTDRQLSQWYYNPVTRTIRVTNAHQPGNSTQWNVLAVTPNALTVETTVIENGKPVSQHHFLGIYLTNTHATSR